MVIEELLDIVSEADEVMGVESRSIIYEKKLSCFRVVNGFIINSEKKIWIPRRHPQKKIFPLHLDASVGGHVSSGESYEQAFIRETQEEVNIILTPEMLKPLARLTPAQDATSSFMWVYGIFQDNAPNYNTDDFVDAYWLSIDEFFELLSQGEKVKDDLPIMLGKLKKIL